MLLSHAHRFIFLKPYKTGGTSLEFLLGKFMGEDDIITPVWLMDEAQRELHGSVPRNFLSVRHPPLTADIISHLKTEQELMAHLHSTALIYPRFHEHMPASDVRGIVPATIWDSYLKISMTRHPYEVVVSSAYFYPLGDAVLRGRTISVDDLRAAVDAIIGKFWTSNVPIYTIDGSMAADYMIRYEAFEADIRHLLVLLGFPHATPFPRLKTQFRQERRAAAELLTEEQKRRIYDINAREFELFGYAR